VDYPDYRCPCGETRALEVWRGPLQQSGLDRDFLGLACSRCGLVSLYPPVTDEEMSAAAHARGWKGLHCPQARRSAGLKVRVSAARLFRELVTAELPPPASVLDIGAGTGGMAIGLRDSGYQVMGIEPDPEMAAEAAAQGIEVHTTTFEDWPLTGTKYDGVLMSNVLEHLAEPLQVLKKVKRLLAPGGRLFIEVPNIQRCKTSYRRALQLVHKWYFSPASLAYLLGAAGLSPLVERVFRVDCMQVVAGHAVEGGEPPAAGPDLATDIGRRLRRHRWLYYARFQFIWRKVPLLRQLIFFTTPRVKRYS